MMDIQSDLPQPRPAGKAGGVTNRSLVLAILVVSVLWLSFLASALVLGILNPPAPRTAVERSIGVYGDAVEQGTTDAVIWADYISALIAGKQYSRAEGAIEDALAAVTDKTSLILAQRTRLDFELGDYESTVESADGAIAASREETDIMRENFAKRGITSEPDPSPALANAQLLKAQALAELMQFDDAIEVLDEFLETAPSAADALVLRASYKREAGDIDGARADYEQALLYIPDYAAALEGLESIGAID